MLAGALVFWEVQGFPAHPERLLPAKWPYRCVSFRGSLKVSVTLTSGVEGELGFLRFSDLQVF